MFKKNFIIILVILAAMFMCNSFVMGAEDVAALIKNADEAIAKVETLSTGNVGGFSLGQKMASLGDAGIISALKGYEQYISQAFSMIQNLKSEGSNVTDSINALRTSGRKNLDILDGLQKKTNLSQSVKDALGGTIVKVKDIQKRLQAL